MFDSLFYQSQVGDIVDQELSGICCPREAKRFEGPILPKKSCRFQKSFSYWSQPGPNARKLTFKKKSFEKLKNIWKNIKKWNHDVLTHQPLNLTVYMISYMISIKKLGQLTLTYLSRSKVTEMDIVISLHLDGLFAWFKVINRWFMEGHIT